jgi:predicted nuclease of predicted toxin-antitoxin system
MLFNFFIDQCVPFQVVKFLQDAEYNTFILRDFIPIESPDSVVIAKAQELDSILISLNGDFADIVTYPPSLYGGIISLQVKNHPEIIPRLMNLLINYLQNNSDRDHYRGKLLIVESHRIRIK